MIPKKNGKSLFIAPCSAAKARRHDEQDEQDSLPPRPCHTARATGF